MAEDTQGTTAPLQNDNGTLYTTTVLSPPRMPSATTSPSNDGSSKATHGTAIAAESTDDGNTTLSLVGGSTSLPSVNKAKDTNAIILQPPSQDFLPFGLHNTPAGAAYYALLSVLSQDFIYGVKMVNESRKLFCSDEYPLSFTGVEAVVRQESSNLGSLFPAHSLITSSFYIFMSFGGLLWKYSILFGPWYPMATKTSSIATLVEP